MHTESGAMEHMMVHNVRKKLSDSILDVTADADNEVKTVTEKSCDIMLVYLCDTLRLEKENEQRTNMIEEVRAQTSSPESDIHDHASSATSGPTQK